MTVALDTSGTVPKPSTPHHVTGSWAWSDLDPFTQGYVRAALRESAATMQIRVVGNIVADPGFADLAPETLAAIMKDCATMQGVYKAAKSEADGATAYRLRQTGKWDAPPPFSVVYLKPIHLSLGNDGLIYAGGVG